MSTIRTFEELRVYQMAHEAACRIYELSRTWPPEERYSLTAQIRSSSRSVCANIAEAWHKRRYPGHFESKLSDAEAEAAETRVWLRFATRSGHLTNEAFASLDKDYRYIVAQLITMGQQAAQWCSSVVAARTGRRIFTKATL